MDMENSKAYDLGYEAGKNAAGWVFDGNTTRATYEYVLKGIEEGDPMVLDSIGENLADFEAAQADDLESLGIHAPNWLAPAYMWDEFETACQDWEMGASTGFWHEIERAARYQLGD
jgi:hypothetical protein